jgi:phosphatidylethanolamine/phosphatidyl-N-methylethanolamine N-methyltransferase
MRQQWADYRVFWREFRQAYHTTGAVLPSGPALSAALTRFVPSGEATSSPNPSRRILEVGPGTGAVTGHIIRHLRPNDRLVLVERNEQFVAHLRARLADEPAFKRAAPQVSLVHASVEDVPDEAGYDLIISGLPLNNFDVASVEQILAKLRALLTASGTLSFFEYVAIRRVKAVVSSRADRQRLRGIERVLKEVLSTKEIRRDLVFANVPPAWVHHVRFG